MFTPGILVLLVIVGIVIYALRREGKFGSSSTPQRYANIDDRYRAQRKQRQEQVDAILEKISRRGVASLTKKERELLEEHSRSVK